MSILITAANSAQAQKLKSQLSNDEVILGDYLDLPTFMLSKNLIKLPNPNSIAYTHEMLTLCLDKQIVTIYPLRDEELSLLKQAEQLFNEYGVGIASGH